MNDLLLFPNARALGHWDTRKRCPIGNGDSKQSDCMFSSVRNGASKWCNDVYKYARLSVKGGGTASLGIVNGDVTSLQQLLVLTQHVASE